MALLLLAVASQTAAATANEDPLRTQNTPPPPPEPVPVFYNATNLFTESQMAGLLHDAYRLTSIDIPTLVFLRIADSEHADPASNQAFADTLRASWGIASSPGADDGLVLLVTLDKQGYHGHSLALSYGARTFADSGLTPDYIASVFERHVLPRFAEGHYYEGMYNLMRRVRYGGIYFPPPIDPLTGPAQTLHRVLGWAAPLTLIAMVAIVAVGALRPPALLAVRRPWRRAIGIGGALVTLVLAVLSVVARSETGVISTLLLTLLLGLAAWLRTRPARDERPARILVVPTVAQHLPGPRHRRLGMDGAAREAAP